MPRNTAGLKRGGSPGRPKGSKNKATVEVRTLAQDLLLGEEYQANLKKRLIAGTLAPAVENTLWHYGFGKPKDSVDVSLAQNRKVIHIIPPDVPVEPVGIVDEKDRKAAPPEPLTDAPQTTKPAVGAVDLTPETPPRVPVPPKVERRTYGPSAWPTRRSR